jgi:tyrosinase
MAKGYHQKFVEMHVEFFSELEAHRNCMFIYWHRLYLLGYENMLRSLDSKYSCVTLPVWDHLAATARESAGVCSSMEGCAPIISDFGGSTVGYKSPTKTAFVVYNVTIPFTLDPPLKPLPFPRTCVTKGVAYNFCGNSSTCPHCIMRGAPTKVKYPPSAAFASVYNQVFDYNTWASFADAIEKGVHSKSSLISFSAR